LLSLGPETGRLEQSFTNPINLKQNYKHEQQACMFVFNHDGDYEMTAFVFILS